MSQASTRLDSVPDTKAQAAWVFRVLGVPVQSGQGKPVEGLRKRLSDDLRRLKDLANPEIEKAVGPLVGSITHEMDAGDVEAALPLLGRLEEVLTAAERKKSPPPRPSSPPTQRDPNKALLGEIEDLMKILDSTDKEVKSDAKKFDDFLHLDDIVLSGVMKTPEKTELLKVIDKTVRTVLRGRETFVTPARQLEERIKLSTDQEVQKKAGIQNQCGAKVQYWESLIPPGILDEAALIKDRVAALTVKPGSPEQGKLKRGAEQKISGLKGQVDEFKQIVEGHSPRSFTRTDPFATKMLTSLDGDERKKLQAMQEELARAGQVFLDATISVEKLNEQGISGDQRETRYDFQELYEKIIAIGLPEVWWPPRLVERVQAWRKASRVHSQEMAKPKSTAKEIGQELLGAFGQLADGFSFGMDIFNFDNSFKPTESGPTKPDHSPEAIAEIAGGVCDILNGLPDHVKGIVSGEDKEQLKALNPKEAIELGERLEQALALVQKPTEFANQAAGLIDAVAKYAGTDWYKTFDAKVVPGLGLAIHVFKLIDAIKETAKSAMLTAKTQRLGVTSDQQNATGLRQDGGTTTGALKKAEQSQKEYTGRKGLEVFTESVHVTAEAVKLSGVSAPAGYGLSATAHGIELAGAMVFDGIDWSQAKVAKKLLEDARAGSMIAQQLLFEKCETYAKLYLAILVREGDPLGKKYIADRGITQDNLDKPSSVWLLGEALRDAVQKEDDTEIDDNLAKHLAGPLGKLAGRMKDGVVDGVTFVVEKGRQALAEEYDPNWKPPRGVSLDPAVWTEIKDSAVDDGGLRNDTTGITAALTNLQKTIGVYDELANPKKPLKKGQKAPGDKDKLKAISQVLQHIGVVSGTLSGWSPVKGKNPREDHEPMRAVLDAMHKLLTAETNKYRTAAGQLPGVTLGQDQDGNAVIDIPPAGWTGLAAGGKVKDQWDRTWQGAIDSIGIAAEDFGTSGLLATVQKEWDGLRELEDGSQIVDTKNGKLLYKARKGALDALGAARNALGRVAKSVQLFPNLAAFVGAAQKDMATRTRALDDAMCSANVSLSLNSKPGLPAHDPQSTATAFQKWAGMWLTSWTYAAQLGFVSADGGNALSAALNGFGSDYAAYLALQPNAEDRPSKRDTVLGDGAKALKACDALMRAEPYAPDSILALVRAYATDVTAGRQALVKEVSSAQVLDPTALGDLQKAIPGAVDPGGKGLIATNDLQGPWEKAYAECLKQGVAAKSDSGGALGKQLGKIKTGMEEANTYLATGKCDPKDLPTLYKAMDEVRKQIGEAIKLVNKLLAAPGFAANDQIMDLLSALGAEFSNYLEVIEDRKGKIEVTAGSIDADQYSKAKDALVKQKLAPSTKTGLGDLMKKVKGAKGKSRDKAIGNLKKKIDEIVLAAEQAMAQSKQPQQPPKGKKAPEPVVLDYAPWINYLKEMKAAAK